MSGLSILSTLSKAKAPLLQRFDGKFAHRSLIMIIMTECPIEKVLTVANWIKLFGT